jgi:hypothetical protein
MSIRIAVHRQSLGALVLAFASVLSISEAGQAPPVVWEKTFGGASADIGYCICPTSDTGYAILGFTSSFATPTMTGNAYLIKVDGEGVQQWAKVLGRGTENYAEVRACSMAPLPGGGYILVGSIFEPHFDRRICLIKADADGNQLWQQQHELTAEPQSYEAGESVDVTDDGGFIIAGHGRVSSTATVQTCLLKTNAAGEREWLKLFGGANIDEGHDAHQTSDGGYILTGITASTPTENDDVFLIKTDAEGNVQWQKTYGGDLQDRGRSVRQTADGGYIIAGDSNSTSTAATDIFLVKTDTSGTLRWQNHYGGPSTEYGYCVRQTADGGYIVAGQTFSVLRQSEEMYLVKTDADGKLQWQKAIGGAEEECGYCVRQTSDDGYLVIGQTQSYGAGIHDIYLVKIAPYALAATPWSLYE